MAGRRVSTLAVLLFLRHLGQYRDVLGDAIALFDLDLFTGVEKLLHHLFVVAVSSELRYHSRDVHGHNPILAGANGFETEFSVPRHRWIALVHVLDIRSEQDGHQPDDRFAILAQNLAGNLTAVAAHRD